MDYKIIRKDEKKKYVVKVYGRRDERNKKRQVENTEKE